MTELVVLNILPSGDLYVRICIPVEGLLSSSVCLCLFNSFTLFALFLFFWDSHVVLFSRFLFTVRCSILFMILSVVKRLINELYLPQIHLLFIQFLWQCWTVISKYFGAEIKYRYDITTNRYYISQDAENKLQLKKKSTLDLSDSILNRLKIDLSTSKT